MAKHLDEFHKVTLFLIANFFKRIRWADLQIISTIHFHLPEGRCSYLPFVLFSEMLGYTS